jgi:hypothetical protein
LSRASKIALLAVFCPAFAFVEVEAGGEPLLLCGWACAKEATQTTTESTAIVRVRVQFRSQAFLKVMMETMGTLQQNMRRVGVVLKERDCYILSPIESINRAQYSFELIFPLQSGKDPS